MTSSPAKIELTRNVIRLETEFDCDKLQGSRINLKGLKPLKQKAVKPAGLPLDIEPIVT
jgi:hypothetical protein